MKHVKVLFLFLFAAIALWSCKKNIDNISYSSGTDPVLQANFADNDTIPLKPSDSAKVALILSWTNPNYVFSNGISSQGVTYLVEIDSTGNNFANTNTKIVPIVASLGDSITIGQLNSYLTQGALTLATDVPHQIQIRVTSTLGSTGSAPLNSNVFNYVITPYSPPPLIAPPSSYADNPNGDLFIVGSATPGGSSHGWDNPISQSAAVQQYTKVSNTEYTITIALLGGQEYKLIGVNGSWNDQWSVAVTDDPTEVNGGAFVFNGNNALAPAATGTYVIDVNFQTGIFTVTPQ
jgi:hypothetical protein